MSTQDTAGNNDNNTAKQNFCRNLNIVRMGKEKHKCADYSPTAKLKEPIS